MTAVRSTRPAALAERFDRLPIEALRPSPTNPRTHFPEAYITELATSIREKGLIHPIVVREWTAPPADPADPVYEIVAGECRYRAMQRAGLGLVPVIVRDYTDDQVLEVQLIENIHRTDLTPLEQAAGYRRLIDSNPTKHSADTIATRVGMSPAWVWDRLKLNDLIASVKDLLEREVITVGHAILIARLKPGDQARVVKTHPGDRSGTIAGGLWRRDDGFDFDDAAAARRSVSSDVERLKPCSIRELEAWIRDHVRFDVEHAAKAQPLEFEATAQDVALASAMPGRGKKVVPITYEYRVADDARAGDERTYGRDAWRRADGQEKSETCEHSVLGVVVAGRGRGTTLQVCVARDKCRVHFADVIRQREKNQKLRDSGQAKKAAANEAKQKAKEADARQQRELAALREQRIADAAIDQALERVTEATPEILRLALAEMLKGEVDFDAFRARFNVRVNWQTQAKDLSALSGRTLVQALVFCELSSAAGCGVRATFAAGLKAFGVDLAKVEKTVDAAAQIASGKPAKKAKR